MKLETLNGEEGAPILLSSFIANCEVDRDLTVVIGGQDMSIYNDTDDYFTIDSDFITENVIHTLNSYKAAGTSLSPLFLDAIQACYEENGGANHVVITNDVVMTTVHGNKIVKREMAQVFGLLLGVYIAGRTGYSKIFIDTIDAFLHPSRQRHVMNQLSLFSAKLSQLWKDKQAADRSKTW